MADWTELYLSNWRDVTPLMKRLGIKGGQESYTVRKNRRHDLSAASIADDGEMMITRGPIVEHWDAEGVIGVHLVWDYRKNTFDELLEMASVDSPLYSGLAPGEARELESMWVPSQGRMVMTVCPGTSNESFWNSFFAAVEDFGDCRLHYNSDVRQDDVAAQFSKMFCGVFGSATFKSTTDVIVTPNGIKVQVGEAHDRRGLEDWIGVVGFDLEQVTMTGPLGSKNRKALSVASAFWASRNWNLTRETLTEPPQSPEWAEKVASMGASPDLLVTVRPARLAIKKRDGEIPQPAVGDMIACDSCTLFDDCRLARAGSVCVIPESDMGELADFFKTRDAAKITEGLGDLLGRQADRVEQAIAAENMTSELNPDVTALINQLFDRGVKLAKLMDPKLNSRGPQVNIGIGAAGSVQMIEAGSPQQLAAGVIAELEQRGVRREDITPELIQQYLAGAEPQAIEAKSVSSDPFAR